MEQGKPTQALAYLERALELEPDHQASLLNSAIILQEMAANDNSHEVNSSFKTISIPQRINAFYVNSSEIPLSTMQLH